MILVGARKPVTEQSASERVDKIFQELKQSLRVTGVNLNFRAYAAYEAFFPAMWEAMRPNVETRAFEDASDHLRAEAVHAAAGMERLSVLARAQLGESQAFQAESALLLYHYINPKLLIFQAALAKALEQDTPEPRAAAPAGSPELIERGAPARMPPMEMIEEPADDPSARRALADMKRTLNLEELHSDYRTLALWPKYLTAAWQRMKPMVKTDGYDTTCVRLGELARRLCDQLPYPIELRRDALAASGEDMDAVLADTKRFEAALPGLILNVSLLVLDWQAPELARRSPFPAKARGRVEAL